MQGSFVGKVLKPLVTRMALLLIPGARAHSPAGRWYDRFIDPAGGQVGTDRCRE